MSFYQKLADFGQRYVSQRILFKYGFNLSPMYRRSTGRITSVSEDLKHIEVKLPISYKNRNYVNSIFGGSLFSAVDPIPMVQLINLIGKEYVVWDKSAEIFFKIPARESLYAEFTYSEAELEAIKAEVAEKKETEIVRVTQLTDKAKTKVFCEVRKTIYVAEKAFFKEKQRKKAEARGAL